MAETHAEECFSEEEIGALAKYRKSCELLRLNYESTQSAFEKALAQREPSPWNDKVLVTSSVVVAFAIGLLAGSQIRRD